MFLVSSAKPIDPQLRESVDNIEQQSPSLSVLAARQFRYSLLQTQVQLTISEPRKFNVLEEFVLRAGIELDPSPSEDELASVLGLDPVFVRSTTANLQALQTLELAPGSPIKLTPQGREFYEKGSVPQPPKTKQIYAIADPLVGNLTFQSSGSNVGQVDDIPDLADFVTIENRIPNASALSLEELQELVRDSGLGLHAPEEGKIVTSCRVAAPPESIWQPMSLFVIFDAITNEVRLEAKQGKKILQEASNWLNALLAEDKISLNALCELADEEIKRQCEQILDNKNAEVEERIEKIRQKAREIAEQRMQKPSGDSSEPKSVEPIGTEVGTAVQLRGSEISSSLKEILNNARREILLYSPWVSAKVVNNDFIEQLRKLANKGVWILIGHGISSSEAAEERPIPPKVEAQLRAIHTCEGLPAVQVCWLGGSHAKEVIVDREVHLCGSNNYLSCRADWRLWDEAVYKVTIPDQVQKAYEFYAGRFKVHAQKLWNAAVLNRDSTLAVEPMSMWAALGMEEMALNQLQDNNWLELLPVWLKVVCNGLRSKKVSPDSACFGTALSKLSQISAEDPNIESLRSGWQKVVGAIANHDRNAALMLLSDEAWTQFTRLGIAQPSIDSPEKFIKYTLAQNKPNQNSQPKRRNASNQPDRSRR